MDQEPEQASSEPAGDKPKLFQNVNAVIAGVTGLVVALAGLAAATRDMWGSKEAEQPVLAAPAGSAAGQPLADTASSNEQPPAARPTIYKGKL